MRFRHVTLPSLIPSICRPFQPMSRSKKPVSMQNSLPLNRPVRLVLDFDGTLTKKDTMHLVAQAGYARQEELKTNPQPRPWTEIVDAYMMDFKRHVETYIPRVECRTSIKDELSWLSSLKEIEKASATRALNSGLFNQMRACDMERVVKSAFQSGKLQLRDGWLDLLSTVRAHNSKHGLLGGVAVLSVNWSQEFIRQALDCENESRNAPWLADLSVYANEVPSIVADHTDQAPFKQSREIRTSNDKAKLLNDLIDESPNALSIYIGDSSTDLECLFSAEIGICIRDQPLSSGQEELAATCDRIKLQVLHVNNLDSSHISSRGSNSNLLWATNFTEIRNLLFSDQGSIHDT